MFKKFISILRSREPDREDTELYVTPVRMGEVFEFGRSRGITGFAFPETEAIGLARIIDWQPDTQAWTVRVDAKPFKVGDQVSIPPHIKWSSYPHFRYVGLIKDALEFRSGDGGESAWFLAQPTREPATLREIDTLFEYWHSQLSSRRTGRQLEEELFDLGIATRATPINGFTVLSVTYPNHLHANDPPYTAVELATLLARSMDLQWFGTDKRFDGYSVTAVQQGNGENSDAYAFDFGPFEEEEDDFEWRFTVIVRETAGGGFMLLIDDVGGEHSAKIKALYDALPNQEYRLPGGRSHEVT
jgi:hypothetical protein